MIFCWGSFRARTAPIDLLLSFQYSATRYLFREGVYMSESQSKSNAEFEESRARQFDLHADLERRLAGKFFAQLTPEDVDAIMEVIELDKVTGLVALDAEMSPHIRYKILKGREILKGPETIDRFRAEPDMVDPSEV